MRENEAEDKQILRRFQDLAALSDRKGSPTNTNFLSLAEQSLFYEQRASFSSYPYTVTGGYPDAERRIIIFGLSEAETEADAANPLLSIIQITRKNTRFTAPPSHRDYLGALLNLGIKRELLGDILLGEDGSGACVFCISGISAYLCENLQTVRNDNVTCKQITALPPQYGSRLESDTISVASTRLDAIVAAAWHLSRDESHAYFTAGKVFVSGRCVTDGSSKPHPEEIISVRGIGRIKYIGEAGATKKGRARIEIQRYL